MLVVVIRMSVCRSTHSHTGNVGMPYLRQKFHDRRLERILVRDADVDFESAALIWGPWWAFERTLQLSDAVTDGVDVDVGHGISLDICQFLCYSSSSVTGHLESVGSVVVVRYERWFDG